MGLDIVWCCSRLSARNRQSRRASDVVTLHGVSEETSSGALDYVADLGCWIFCKIAQDMRDMPPASYPSPYRRERRDANLSLTTVHISFGVFPSRSVLI